MTVATFPQAEKDAAFGPRAARSAKLRSLAIARDEPAAASTRAGPRRRWPGALIAVIGVQTAALAWLATGGDVPGIADAPAAAVSAPALPTPAVAATPAAGVKFEAQGFVAATRRATVSSRVAGIVTAVNVEAGDRVEPGQVLGQLDADLARRDLRLAEEQLGVLRARVASAAAQQRQAGSEQAREQALFDREFSTRARMDTKRTATDVAQAGLASARADLAVAELQVRQQRSVLSNYTIRAPFGGIVVEKNAQPGELLAPTGAGGGFTRTGFCTIVDMSSLEIVVDVSEQLVTRVRPGQPVEIGLYAYKDLKIAGQVSRIMPSADRAKGTLQVRIALLDKDPRVLPDMGARVAFL